MCSLRRLISSSRAGSDTVGVSQDHRLAIAAYRQAVALDPPYAAAYSGLAFAEYWLATDTGASQGLKAPGPRRNERSTLLQIRRWVLRRGAC